MGRRHFKPEQIIHMLREAEIKLAGGKTTGEVCRDLGISEQSYYRWRKEYGGMQVSQAKKLKDLKDLERENVRLKKLVAEQALDKAILEEALKGKY
jgi:transposase-like protein